ncbi:hypothetical protein Baya_15157 [Bagarius yarrelli]|uniref:Uncharacterized protein n=1 Tax=Bagarius yarrelli TaxID=175774 RepID=A0A556VB99_BAGYA|nr:hypothetical protein Baya_15157 [Bagarius yarrelli]
MDKNNCCTVCTGLNREYEGRDESETKTKFNSEFFKNVREELKINKRQKEEKKSIVEKLQEDLSKAREEKAELVEEAYRTIMKLLR